MPINFEKATRPEQLKRIEKLAFAIWNEHYTPIIGQQQVEYMLEKFQSYAAMEDQIAAQGYEYYSIFDEQSLIGYFAVQPQSDSLFLSKLYLSSSERGKGYSRTAQNYIEQLASQKGLGSLKLTVNKYNSGSINAYKALGFKIEKEAVFDIGGGYVMDDYVMAKQL